jgi:hypothetical protein
MQCDWVNKSIGFLHQGQQITLQGLIHKQVEQVEEISGEHLLKLHKGNDVWAMVVLSQVTESEAMQEQYMK